MIIRKTFFSLIYLLYAFQTVCAVSIAEQFQISGYIEICNQKPAAETFQNLYAYFDELIEFLHNNPVWSHKLYSAKERFIRSKDRNYYSTDVFGFYDESKTAGRSQISFYYSTHFHRFINTYYPEFNQIPEILAFFEACFDIQNICRNLFNNAASELGLDDILSSSCNQPPILFKVIKYLPSYFATRPHYDGTAFSLFLDSTDNLALLLSPYKTSFTVDDFSSPTIECSEWHNRNSILLIPGTLLAEFSIAPTPHFVSQTGKTRYAAIAFAMRPNYTPPKNQLTPLPNFIR